MSVERDMRLMSSLCMLLCIEDLQLDLASGTAVKAGMGTGTGGGTYVAASGKGDFFMELGG